MDFVKKAASGLKGDSAQNQNDPNAQGGEKEDYVDKGNVSTPTGDPT